MNPGDRVGEVLGLGVDVERGIGEVIPIQATRIPGALTMGGGEDGSAVSMVHATGNIEKVMDESRRVATTGILHCAEGLGVDPRSTRAPVHLHFLGASTRKDGPSAGCAIALALTSLLSGRPIRRDVAVTGEIDTQGRITGVGGVDIKLETAVEAGCHTLIIPRENLDGPGGVARFPESLKRELQILDYDQWKGDHEAFDPQRHVIQVVAVEHVTEAADVAILDESEIEGLEVRFGDDGRRLARRFLEQGVAPHRGPMVVVARNAAEADPARVQPALCADCAGCHLVVDAPLSEEIDRNLRGTGSRARTVVWDPEHQELGHVVASLDGCIDPAEDAESGLAVVAPYFALRDARNAIESRTPHARLLANNFALQGVKLKSIRTVLDAVYCRLLHLGAETLDGVGFLALHEGITVVDLTPIPEKYRLDLDRAETILIRVLSAWLNQVDETLATRRAS
jgi:ATP-dependent Lon protease